MSLRKILMTVCLSCLFAAGGALTSSAQQIAVKTNALMWGALTPNVGCEIVAGEHTSFDFSVFGNYMPYTLPIKMFGIQPEFKYWFGGRPLIREFIGVALLYTNYDIRTRKRVYDGDALGLGITCGYVLSMGKRWNVEFSASYGIVGYTQKQYSPADNYEDYYVGHLPKNNSLGYVCLPVDLGVTFTYIIK